MKKKPKEEHETNILNLYSSSENKDNSKILRTCPEEELSTLMYIFFNERKLRAHSKKLSLSDGHPNLKI